MNHDTLALIAGSTLAILVGQITNDNGLSDLIKGLSASGVLAITFYWIMQRFEKRLDKAFDEYKELSQRLLDILLNKEDDKDE